MHRSLTQTSSEKSVRSVITVLIDVLVSQSVYACVYMYAVCGAVSSSVTDCLAGKYLSYCEFVGEDHSISTRLLGEFTSAMKLMPSRKQR